MNSMRSQVSHWAAQGVIAVGVMDYKDVMIHLGGVQLCKPAVQVWTSICMLHEGKQSSKIGQPIRPEALAWKCTMVDLTDLEFL